MRFSNLTNVRRNNVSELENMGKYVNMLLRALLLVSNGSMRRMSGEIVAAWAEAALVEAVGRLIVSKGFYTN